MKSIRSFFAGKLRSGCLAGVSFVACLALPVARADIPDVPRTAVAFHGVYKIKASNDPAFAVSPGSECFLDFGRGLDDGAPGGSVAVSVRVNPHVKVRILSWEYFPERNLLMIGNPFAHGSRKAVAIGAWQLRGTGESLVLSREGCRVLLVRADPKDY
jgi:hypothetical protein